MESQHSFHLLGLSKLFGCHKTFAQAVEEQNTKVVRYPRVHGLPRKYVYGKVPGKPVLTQELHPEGRPWPSVEPEQNPVLIREHIAICSHEMGSKGGLCEMCRKLNNPQRLDFLVRLYQDGSSLDTAGFNVGYAVEKSELKQSATSIYLKQLSVLGLVRRVRDGRVVNYVPDPSRAAPQIREVAELLRQRWLKNPEDLSFVPVFRVMMGPFRSQVVRMLAAGESGTVEYLCERFCKKPQELMRALEWAVRGGLLSLTSEDRDGVYGYIAPADPIARRIIELS